MGSNSRCVLCWYYCLTTATTIAASTPALSAWVTTISLRPHQQLARSTRKTFRIPTRYHQQEAFSSTRMMFSNSIVSGQQLATTDNEGEMHAFAAAAAAVGQKDIGLVQNPLNNDNGGGIVVDNNNNNNNNDVGTGQVVESWRRLIERSMAKARNVRGGNFVQMATVDATTMEARCRTVVFRGFLQHHLLPQGHFLHPCTSDDNMSSCVMKMITHLRSKKVSEIIQNDKAEIVWWFPLSNEQYRIRGRVVLIGNDGIVDGSSGGGGGDSHHRSSSSSRSSRDPVLLQARREQWGNLRDGAREEYFRAPTPGESFELETHQPVVPAGGRDENTGKLLPPPNDFLLMLLVPNRVDYLRLTNMYRQIEELQDGEDGVWLLQRVNP